MKRLIILALFLSCFLTGFSQESIINKVEVNWEESFRIALKKSKKEKKPVLIYFTGSDWCGPCKVLDEKLFSTKKFKDLSDRDFILYKADNPRNKDLLTSDQIKENSKLIRKFKVKSYPTIIAVNHKGKEIASKQGLILTEYYYPFFQSIIENY
jgi:thioredoxin-related protein